MVQTLTDESKDVPDGGDEDDQGVGAGQQDHGDGNVADPAEVLGGAQEVVDRGADLRGRECEDRSVTRFLSWEGKKTHLNKKKIIIPFWSTYGEKHHRDGEGDGGQHGQANDEQEYVSLVDLGVGVQQLGLHVNCREKM